MNRWNGKVGIVTGTSSGIGAAIAAQLVEKGLIVVGLGRRKERGKALGEALKGKKGQFHYFPADISKEQDVLKVFEWTEKNLGPVHVLINNAGVGSMTSLVDGDAEEWRRILDTNVLGLCAMTREAVKNMRKHQVDGHIVHIGSIDGHRITHHYQGINVYAASKYAVRALTETLRQELVSIGSEIKISAVSCGLVKTELLEVSGVDASVIEQLMSCSLEPEDVADTVLYILSTPPQVQVHDIIVKPL